MFAIRRARTTGAWGGGSPRSPPHSVGQDRRILLGQRQKILCIWDILTILMRETGPRATGCRSTPFYRRARACPSPPSGSQKASRLTCSQSGDRELQGPHSVEQDRPILLYSDKKSCWILDILEILLRGTGPRATGPQHVSFYRRARACPSPASVSPKASGLTCSRSGDRELQGPLCRAGSPDPDMFAIRRSRTTGAWGRRVATGTAPLCRAGSPDPARSARKNPAAGDRPPLNHCANLR